MSTLTEQPSTPLNSLLYDIGKELDIQQVRYMKYLLQGHISKETLQYLESGFDLTDALRKRGLVSGKRLAFLRKLLVEAKCLKLVHLVDDFKEKCSPGVCFGERNEDEAGSPRRSGKREAILRMIERLENEISVLEESQSELTNETKQYEMQIQENNERLVQEEDEIQKLKEHIKEKESSIESFERKLETVRFFLKKHEVELDKIKQKLEQNKSSANVKMELKEKMGEYETGKKDEDELICKHQQALDEIRTNHVEIRHRTEEIIQLEDHIHDYYLQVRMVKHSIYKNQRARVDFQEKLDNLSVDLDETNRQNPMTPAMTSRAQSQLKSISRAECLALDKIVEYKVLDYNEITGQEASVIGRKGKSISPVQFNLPVGVAIDVTGHLYVADYGNGRVLVLDTDGRVQRQPLHIGGKSRPCALASSHRGDLAVTDSQIIRVFNKNGEFLRPILPVFSKNDRRPELCSISFDNECCIYTGDRANHRIQRFTFEGKFLHFIGGPEEINYPIGIAVTKHGDVIVSDHLKHHLTIFFSEKLLKTKIIGSKGLGMCKFAHPRGIALDQHENILVADSYNHRIQVLDLEGEYIGSFGTIGDNVGSLNTPYDVTMDHHGNIVVADTKNHRVQVFTRLVPIYFLHDNENDGISKEDRDAEKYFKNDEGDAQQDETGIKDPFEEKANENGQLDTYIIKQDSDEIN